MPRGEVCSSLAGPEIVEPNTASISLLMAPFHIALLLANSTILTSLAVRSANASIASAFWLSAGEPTTKPMRLPFRSA